MSANSIDSGGVLSSSLAKTCMIIMRVLSLDGGPRLS